MTTVVSLSSYEYAAGPWALRLTGQVSSLSGLAERVVLRRSRFQLRLGEDLAEGDLAGEDWLDNDSASPTTRQGDSPAVNSRDLSSQPPIFEVSGHGPDLANLSHLVQDYVQHYLEGQGLTPRQGLSQGGMTLAPVGLTRHRLTVAVTGQAAAVNLSLLQLADLAAVLAQVEQAVEHLPEALAPSRRRAWPRVPLWTGSVAAVLVAAVLGSQWLGQMPSSVVQSPTPTTETPSQAEDFAQEPDPEAAVGGAARLEEEASLAEEDVPAGADSANRSAPEALAPSARPSPESASERALERMPPEISTASPDPSPTPSSSATPPSAESPRPAPGARANPPSPASDSPRPAADSGLAAPNPAAGSPPAARTPSPQEGMGTAESSPETAMPLTVAPSRADGIVADWPETLRTTLQDNWSPIPGLASPLRYRLSLGPTGEVLALDPLTAPARQYLTQGTLPPVGAVIPNLRLPEPTTVEIELLPSGDVQVYPSPNP